MATPEHYARKEALIKEIAESRELIKGLTQQLRPLIDELESLKDYEILEISENWLESRESIDAVLDRAWDNGRGNRMGIELIENHLEDIRPLGVPFWHEAGFYQVAGRTTRVIGVSLGLNFATDEEALENTVKAIEQLCNSVGDAGEDYFLPIMCPVEEEYYVLYPATNEIKMQNWGVGEVVYKGESLIDALEYISGTFPYDEDGK